MKGIPITLHLQLLFIPFHKIIDDIVVTTSVVDDTQEQKVATTIPEEILWKGIVITSGVTNFGSVKHVMLLRAFLTLLAIEESITYDTLPEMKKDEEEFIHALLVL